MTLDLSAAPPPIPEREALLHRLLERRRTGTVTFPGAVPAAAGRDGAESPRPGHPAISLFFFSADLDDQAEDKYRLVLECAELADRLGLHAVWVPERHFNAFGAPYPNPPLLLAAIAARTKRIGLRAGSVVLPLHDPLLVAEDWGMLDALSGGRVALSLASGWHADDFVLDPEVYELRKDVLVERLATVRQLWAGDVVTREGPAGRKVEVQAFPRPRALPDVWLTSSSNPATWAAAGALDLHILTALLEQTVDEIAEKVLGYRRALADAGHDPQGRQVTCMLHTHLAPDAEVVAARVRDPLTRYLSAHLDLFAKAAAGGAVGIRPEDVSEEDRRVLIEHGLQRYTRTAGLFGNAQTCRPMVDRLVRAGVTELGCLVDFGLPADQVLECVRELGRLQAALNTPVSAAGKHR